MDKKKFVINGMVLRSFARGDQTVFVKDRCDTDDDVLARCLLLQKQGRRQEADDLLDSYCSR